MAAYALFFVHLRSDPSLFINSFLFYLISIYRVIYHCSPRSARSSRLWIRAHLRRTGRAMAARIAKGLRAYPEVFLYRSEKASGRTYALTLLGPAVPSALHLLAEESPTRPARACAPSAPARVRRPCASHEQHCSRARRPRRGSGTRPTATRINALCRCRRPAACSCRLADKLDRACSMMLFELAA